MSINSYLQLGSVEALIVRKPIKNLHLSILPPNGRVRITSPEGMNDDVIRTLLALRLPWIKKQRDKFARQDRQSERKYVSGEDHYFLGRRHRLELVYKDEVPAVFLRGKNRIILQVRPNSPTEKRGEIMATWCREQFYPIVERVFAKWEEKIGVRASHWSIMQMKTRWGTCNQRRGRILINLELVKKPTPCLEYVVVHELLHLIEKKHNGKFISMLTAYVPTWKSIKEELNSFVLSHEEWKY